MKNQFFLTMVFMFTAINISPQLYDEQEIAESFLEKSLSPDFGYMQEPLTIAYDHMEDAFFQAKEYALHTFLFCLKKANEIMGYKEPKRNFYRLDDIVPTGVVSIGNNNISSVTVPQVVQHVKTVVEDAMPEGTRRLGSMLENLEQQAGVVEQKVEAILGSQDSSVFWKYLETGKEYAVQAGEYCKEQYVSLTTTQKVAIVGVTAFAGLLYVARKNRSLSYEEDDLIGDDKEENGESFQNSENIELHV